MVFRGRTVVVLPRVVGWGVTIDFRLASHDAFPPLISITLELLTLTHGRRRTVDLKCSPTATSARQAILQWCFWHRLVLRREFATSLISLSCGINVASRLTARLIRKPCQRNTLFGSVSRRPPSGLSTFGLLRRLSFNWIMGANSPIRSLRWPRDTITVSCISYIADHILVVE